jgi:hypothetical protein
VWYRGIFFKIFLGKWSQFSRRNLIALYIGVTLYIVAATWIYPRGTANTLAYALGLTCYVVNDAFFRTVFVMDWFICGLVIGSRERANGTLAKAYLYACSWVPGAKTKIFLRGVQGDFFQKFFLGKWSQYFRVGILYRPCFLVGPKSFPRNFPCLPKACWKHNRKQQANLGSRHFST